MIAAHNNAMQPKKKDGRGLRGAAIDGEPLALRAASIRGAQSQSGGCRCDNRSLRRKVPEGRVVAAEGVRCSGVAPLGDRET